ncbi:sn-glycerol-1-phosphate dehydrogenase [Paenibacillus tarimensis]|uniref:sn-glycerol-1-phosphate dehydrogenase n=1 Tax=Paenibacillus tarimensis TaxID=416012 RepID=UPI001F208CD9|nr:sn-glycerol-1-phosphate dehydrogenase [Paenibacillus tarimensis]MCF2943966.1 sn-glycerol-1-phosphate dehydrogenase [Paenibacillus tarimensis]
METMIERVNRLVAEDKSGWHYHTVTLDEIVVESGALSKVPAYIQNHGYNRVIIVADENTARAAGNELAELLVEAGVANKQVMVKPNTIGDVVADEQTIIQVMLEIDHDTTDLIIAAGSGTIHDVVRFIAYKMNKPFLSVPTAPSVDGFNSKGAPLIIRGDKITIAASSPVAIFADLDILIKAPAALVAAGFGDMLGKYTSLFDWNFGRIAAGEPHSKLAESITKDALEQCVRQAEAIARRDAEGIRSLMNSLIESGLAMLILGVSHPASGAEHHLSHYWEMEYLRLGRKQLLHGAKVGVACTIISELYHRLAAEGWFGQSLESDPADHEAFQAIHEHREEIEAAIRAIPSPEQLKQLLRTVGGFTEPLQLGVDSELLSRSLRGAHHIRPNRFTLLRAYNKSMQSSKVMV